MSFAYRRDGRWGCPARAWRGAPAPSAAISGWQWVAIRVRSGAIGAPWGARAGGIVGAGTSVQTPCRVGRHRILRGARGSAFTARRRARVDEGAQPLPSRPVPSFALLQGPPCRPPPLPSPHICATVLIRSQHEHLLDGPWQGPHACTASRLPDAGHAAPAGIPPVRQRLGPVDNMVMENHPGKGGRLDAGHRPRRSACGRAHRHPAAQRPACDVHRPVRAGGRLRAGTAACERQPGKHCLHPGRLRSRHAGRAPARPVGQGPSGRHAATGAARGAGHGRGRRRAAAGVVPPRGSATRPTCSTYPTCTVE